MIGSFQSVVVAVEREGQLGFLTRASGQALEKLRSTRSRSDVVARSVMIDQTRQVVSGCLLEMFECWHCGIRFVLWHVWLLTRWRMAVSVGQHVRSLDDRWGAKSTFEILCSSFEWEDTWMATGDRTQCSTSNHIDWRVWSLQKFPSEGVMLYLFVGL
jgi:hypothetical protein